MKFIISIVGRFGILWELEWIGAAMI